MKNTTPQLEDENKMVEKLGIDKWLRRKKASLCILAGICAVSLFVILSSNTVKNLNKGGAYVVKIRHYGLDAAEIERSITKPLENAIFSISGIETVQSSSENSLSSVFLRFKTGESARYEAVRDAAQRVYETLPSSTQRPEILSSNNSRVPVWSAAVYASESDELKEKVLMAQTLEKIVKPRFESLEDAGEVIVSGVGLEEIVIVFDQEKLAALGLEAAKAAEILAMNDSIFSGGKIMHQGRETLITVDARYSFENSADSPKNSSLENAFIPLGEGKFVRLSEIAQVSKQERDPDILSRLNGRKTAGISIMGRDGADLRKLSVEVKRELDALSQLWQSQENALKFTVLSDLGAEEAAAFRSIFNAALLGAIMVAFISFLLNIKSTAGRASLNRSGFFCALAIPLICLVSAAVLSTIGFSLNRLMLAGIAAGIGTAVDAVILCSEKIRKCKNYSAAAQSLSEIAGPLIAGTATTVAALIPLLAIESGGAGLIASAIAVISIVALLLSFTLLPPLLLWGLDSPEQAKTVISKNFFAAKKFLNTVFTRISRFMCRALAFNVKFCLRYPNIVLAFFAAISVAAVIALFAKGVDAASYGSEDSVYAQVEFEGGLLSSETDRLLAEYSEKIARNAGIRNVETGARTGSGSLLIAFDPAQKSAQQTRDLARQIDIPGGFVFFHENSAKDRYWEIRIYGDEDKKCREIAEELAFISGSHPLIKERVLNFKPGSKKMVLLPARERFAESKISFSNAAAKVRLGVYGPVVYKRIEENGETDVRIKTSGGNYLNEDVMRKSREGVLGLLTSSMSIDSLMETKEEIEPASIRRIDRRRVASITITTAPMDPRRVKKELGSLFEKMDLPPGYSIEFDPDAIRQAKDLSATVLSLVLAVIFCYMIIASINESFTVPLLVLSAVPPSLAIPALCLALTGSAYNSAVACAFIVVSGMTVNASVLCVDALKTSAKLKNGETILTFYSALRRKMPALLSTTGTTVAGALPFLFLKEDANSLIRILSLTGALGVASSCICSITLIPSIFYLKTFLTKTKIFSNKP